MSSILAVQQVLQNTYAPNREIQKQAEQQLLQLENVKSFLLVLLQIALDDKVDIHIRQASSVYIKNYVQKRWFIRDEEEKKKMPEILDDDKAQFKKMIVDAIVQAHPSLRGSLCVALNHVAQFDFPQQWPNLIADIMKYMGSNDPQKIFGALFCLYATVKAFA